MTEHAQPQSEELKKHGDELANVVGGSGRQPGKTQQDSSSEGRNEPRKENKKE